MLPLGLVGPVSRLDWVLPICVCWKRAAAWTKASNSLCACCLLRVEESRFWSQTGELSLGLDPIVWYSWTPPLEERTAGGLFPIIGEEGSRCHRSCVWLARCSCKSAF